MNIKSSIIENEFYKIKTLNIGATLYEVIYKPKKLNLILNLGSKENYKYKHPYVGSTCGRYAGRISNGKFQIGNKKYFTNKNEGKNTLHGGKKGFYKLIWKINNFTKNKIIYELNSKHLDQGFPGNIKVKCIYELKKNNFFIFYEYISDKQTHINLTNHSYWNLNLNKKINILNHELKLNSFTYLDVNKFLIPTGKINNVLNSSYDFRKFAEIKKKLNFIPSKKKNYTLNEIKKNGFDTTYVIKKNKNNYVGSLKSNNSKIKLNIFSNLPGVQLYTAQKLKYKKKLFPYQGICLETQFFPDSPNKKNFPSTLIKPKKKYKYFTKYNVK